MPLIVSIFKRFWRDLKSVKFNVGSFRLFQVMNEVQRKNSSSSVAYLLDFPYPPLNEIVRNAYLRQRGEYLTPSNGSNIYISSKYIK